jgi:hypothetical protein
LRHEWLRKPNWSGTVTKEGTKGKVESWKPRNNDEMMNNMKWRTKGDTMEKEEERKNGGLKGTSEVLWEHLGSTMRTSRKCGGKVGSAEGTLEEAQKKRKTWPHCTQAWILQPLKFIKIQGVNRKNAEEFGDHAYPMQNSKLCSELSYLGNFNRKFKINLKVKLLAHCQATSFTFRFILSFSLKFPGYDNSLQNVEFCIGYAWSPNSFAFFLFAPWILQDVKFMPVCSAMAWGHGNSVWGSEGRGKLGPRLGRLGLRLRRAGTLARVPGSVLDGDSMSKSTRTPTPVIFSSSQ